MYLVCAILLDILRVQDAEGRLLQQIIYERNSKICSWFSFPKYTPDYIDFTYKDLVKAIGDAIDKQMEEDGSEYLQMKEQTIYNN